MSNNTSNNQNTETQHTEKENDAVTAIEVVKDDTVVYEDGDFDDYNADHNYDTDADDDSSKEDKSKKNGTSNKDDKSEENNQSEQKKDEEVDKNEEADKKDKSEEDDSSGMTLAGMFQWASKLREDFMSEATGMTNDVTEKAAAMTLKKLIDIVDIELAAFDKSVEAAKKLIDTAEEERAKIASRKEKYQGMIDKLDQE